MEKKDTYACPSIFDSRYTAIVFLYALCARYVNADNWNYISYSAISSLPAFVSGMYLAYALYKKSAVIEHVRKFFTTYTVSACAAFAAAFYVKFTGSVGVSLYILPIIYAVCIFIILTTREIKEEGVRHHIFQKSTRHLGKISYGLYAYHMFAVVILQHFLERTMPWFESVAALGLTVIFAQISYTYFESFFLKFK